jgi:hypothetical protein
MLRLQTGLYHSGIEVYGMELWFYGHEFNFTGILTFPSGMRTVGDMGKRYTRMRSGICRCGLTIVRAYLFLSLSLCCSQSQHRLGLHAIDETSGDAVVGHDDTGMERRVIPSDSTELQQLLRDISTFTTGTKSARICE